MPDYPSIEKSWQFSVNQAIAPQGSGAASNSNLLFQIVQALTSVGSNPWQIRGSCNSSTFNLLALGAAGPGTGWSSGASVVFASTGSPHSWIVLRNTALGPGFPEIMLGCDPNGANSVNLWISPSAGFTGGNTTTDPTATDGIQLGQGGVQRIGFGGTGSNVAFALHVAVSSDGQCTRMWVFSGGTFQALWQIERVKNAVSGWTSPWVFNTEYLNPSSNLSWHNLSQTYAGGPSNSTLRFYWTAEGTTNTGALITSLYNAPNDLNGEYPMLPIGLFVWSANSVYSGRHGMFYDLWFGCAVLPMGQLYGGAVAHSFVQIGEYILPWSGAAAMNTS